MRRCRSQFRNPTSQIARPGRLFQLSQMFMMFAMFAMFAMFSMFAMFAMFSRCFRERAMPEKKQNNKKCGIRNAECRCGGPRVSKGLSSKATFPSWNLEFKQPAEAGTQNFLPPRPPKRRPPLLIKEGSFRNLEFSEAGLKTSERFTRFTNFRCFTSFIRFKRYRNIWPLQKMEQSDGVAAAARQAQPLARRLL